MTKFPTTVQELDTALSNIKSRGATPQEMQEFVNEFKTRQNVVSSSAPSPEALAITSQRTGGKFNGVESITQDIMKTQGLGEPKARAQAEQSVKNIGAMGEPSIAEKFGQRATTAGENIAEQAKKGFGKIMEPEIPEGAGGVRKLAATAVSGGAGALQATLGAALSGLMGFVEPGIESAITGTVESMKNAQAKILERDGYSPEEAQKLTEEDWQKGVQKIKQDIIEPAGEFLTQNPDLKNLAEIGAWFIGTGASKKTAGTVAEQAPRVFKEGSEVIVDAATNARNFVSTLKTASKEQKIAKITSRIEELKASNQVQEIQEILNVADEFGIELPASATGGTLAQNIEGIQAQGFFGGGLKERADTAIAKFDEIATGIESKAKTSTEIGESIEKSFQKALNDMRVEKTKLYDDAEKTFQSSKIPAPIKTNAKSIKTIEDRIEQLSAAGLGETENAAEIATLRNFQNAIKNSIDDDNGIFDARKILQSIADRAGFDKLPKDRTTQEKIFGSIWGSLSNDIDDSISKTIPEFKKALDAANKKFKEIKNLEQKDFVRTIQTLSRKGQVDKISERVSSPNISKQEIEAIYKTVGGGTKLDIQQGIMRDIIQKARSSKDGFTPTGIQKQLDKIGSDKLSAVFSKEQIDTLKKLNVLNKALAATQKVAAGSQTGVLAQISPALRGALAIGTFGKSLVADFGITKFLNSGAGQKFLRGLGKKEQRELEKLMIKLEKLSNK